MLALKSYKEKLVGEDVGAGFKLNFSVRLEQFVADIVVPNGRKDTALVAGFAEQSDV